MERRPYTGIAFDESRVGGYDLQVTVLDASTFMKTAVDSSLQSSVAASAAEANTPEPPGISSTEEKQQDQIQTPKARGTQSAVLPASPLEGAAFTPEATAGTLGGTAGTVPEEEATGNRAAAAASQSAIVEGAAANTISSNEAGGGHLATLANTPPLPLMHLFRDQVQLCHRSPLHTCTPGKKVTCTATRTAASPRATHCVTRCAAACPCTILVRPGLAEKGLLTPWTKAMLCCTQISFADVVLVNKADLVDEAQLRQVAFYLGGVFGACILWDSVRSKRPVHECVALLM